MFGLHVCIFDISRGRRINRYYDPTTDQFLSIDPAVSQTNQPYVFTNDDPLNAEDPVGLLPSAGGSESNVQAASLARAYAQAQAKAAAEREAAASALAERVLKALSNNDIPYAGTAADLTRAALKEATSHDNPLTPDIVASDIDIAAGYFSNAITAVGGLVQGYNDTQNGHNVVYSVGDGVSTAGGTWGGAVAGAAICGGPEDGVGIVCGIIGGFVGGDLSHETYKATVR
jgi:hypothetical protein